MENTFQNRIWIFSLIAAPLMVLIAQFFWDNGLVGTTAGWMQVIAFMFWIPAFHAMFEMVKLQFPKYATLGFLIAVFACVGGAGFGYDGIYTEAMGFDSKEAAASMHSEIGFPLIIALFLPGVFFPLCLIGVGILLIRAKEVKIWVGILLIVAAIGFPLSRFPRIDLLAHLDNVLLLISHFLIAITLFNKGKKS